MNKQNKNVKVVYGKHEVKCIDDFPSTLFLTILLLKQHLDACDPFNHK